MLKKYIGFSILFLALLIPSKVGAVYCNDTDKATQMRLATQIDVVPTEQIVGQNAVFNLVVYNITDRLIVKDVETGKTYGFGSMVPGYGIIFLGDKQQGKSYKFEVYTNLPYCENQLLYTLYASVPNYNPYYENSLCHGISYYKFCQKWIYFTLNYDTFEKEVKAYKETIIPVLPEEPNEEEFISVWDTIMDFWTSYYYYITGVIIIGGLVWIYRLKKKDNFDL